MNFWIAFRIAYRALSRNKLRSGLTILGIIIGVGAIIATVGIGRGAEAKLQEQIASLGTNMLIVSAGGVRRDGVRTGNTEVKRLIAEDAEAILQESSAVVYTSPRVPITTQIVYGNQNWNTTVQGVNPEYFLIREWPLAVGDYFTPTDVSTATKVAVLGQQVAQLLFGTKDPVGQTIRIKNLPFRVLGVLTPKGQSPWGSDQDDIIFVPYTTVQKKLRGITWVAAIHVKARSEAEVSKAQEQITTLLRQRHRLQPGTEDDFTVRTLSEMMATAEESSRVMTILLGSVALVCLLVGGIGIMNIMLVSVTERTREIGIRMAVGAQGGDILLQFLIEAVILSVSGGLLGIGVGIGSSWLINRLAQWPILIAPGSILLAFFFGTGVGILFGFYPARKAAQLDPIQALRYE
jgi:putative ABC transport system permease protein